MRLARVTRNWKKEVHALLQGGKPGGEEMLRNCGEMGKEKGTTSGSLVVAGSF